MIHLILVLCFCGFGFAVGVIAYRLGRREGRRHVIRRHNAVRSLMRQERDKCIAEDDLRGELIYDRVLRYLTPGCVIPSKPWPDRPGTGKESPDRVPLLRPVPPRPGSWKRQSH